LIQARAALLGSAGSRVPCGDCTGCCTSAYSIEVRPTDAAALPHIPVESLFRAAGSNHWTVRPHSDGTCPMLNGGRCTIYAERPQTCQDYDCRVFAAAGIEAGGADKAVINRRVRAWRFQYATEDDRRAHAAMVAAAAFIREKSQLFPPATVPRNALGVAALALRVYTVFLPPGPPASAADTGRAIIAARAAFEQTRGESQA
jgi:Fe-S-cluster containining protein